MKKTITTTVALALAATLAFAQDKPAATPAQAAAPPAADPIVMAASGITVRQSEFESAIQTLPAEYQQFVSSPAGKRQFAEEYLRMKLLAAEGIKAGLDKDPEVVRQLSLMRENLVANAQIQKIEKGITLSDAEMMKQYDADKAKYEQVNARHILIAFKGSPAAQQGKPELTEEQAKAKAEELWKKVAGGAKFEELAKTESDDVGSGANGGDLGTFGPGQMVPEFDKAAFGAKVGEVTEPVRTQFGYHLIRVDKHDHTPFEQVKPMIERTERQNKVQAALDALKTTSKATFDDRYFPAPEAPKPAEVTPAAAPTPEKKP